MRCVEYSFPWVNRLTKYPLVNNYTHCPPNCNRGRVIEVNDEVWECMSFERWIVLGETIFTIPVSLDSFVFIPWVRLDPLYHQITGTYAVFLELQVIYESTVVMDEAHLVNGDIFGTVSVPANMDNYFTVRIFIDPATILPPGVVAPVFLTNACEGVARA